METAFFITRIMDPSLALGRSATRAYVSKKFTLLEKHLQRRGIMYMFLVIYAQLNGVCALLAGVPAWRMSSDASTFLRLAFTVARGTGAVIDLNSAILIIVASRKLFTFLRESRLGVFVPFDHIMPNFHALVGDIILAAALLHTACHIFRFSYLKLSNPGIFGDTSLVISGTILLGILVLVRLSSLPKFRRRWFENFQWFHQVGFSLFYAVLLLHGCHYGKPVSWIFVGPALLIYAGDRTVQRFCERTTHTSLSRDAGQIVAPDVVRLQVPRSFSYLAGQYCELKIPAVSQSQWHPFTIASSPHEPIMTFYIKVNGDWTKRLCHMFSAQCQGDGDFKIQLRGPHGAPAQHVGKYEHVILISGGIGSTPFCSVIKDSCNVMRKYMPYESAGQSAGPSTGQSTPPNQIDPKNYYRDRRNESRQPSFVASSRGDRSST